MKDNSLDGHRGKVALSDTTRNTSGSASLKCDLKSPTTASSAAATANDGSAATNFDDDYNEWELGIGDLIIDLDADIEKNGVVGNSAQQGTISHHHHGHHHQNGTTSSPDSGSSTAINNNNNNSSIIITSPNSASATTTFNFLGTQTPCNNSNLAPAMSNSKSPRLTVNSGVGSGTSASTATAPAGVNNVANAPGTGTFEHQATVDKGLKMKIKRKTVGNKYSEAKHEIVQSDTKTTAPSGQHSNSDNAGSANSNNCSSSASNSPATSSDTPKSKHSSSKGRNSSHRDKKEKNRDKDKGSASSSTRISTAPAQTTEVNGVLGVMSPLKISNSDLNTSSPAPPSLCSNSSPLPTTSSASVSVASPSVPRTVTNSPVCNSNSNPPSEVSQPSTPLVNLPNTATVSALSSPPMPNLTLKLEPKFSPSPIIAQSCPVPSVVVKSEDRPASPPLKKIKLENAEQGEEIECSGSPDSIEMKDTSTCTTSTSVGTITEPDCLGPCEPGTSVMLEGIVWQETEGGVLVVNVTWRGKTYVGTLLDCTKHDWAPPRFCESPTSDVDSKTGKGRGKRGRGGNNSSSEITPFADTRNCVQSKLRNGKGRRTTINSNAASSGFTVPNSPAKNDTLSNGKRKGRPAEPEPSTATDSKNSKRSRTQNRAMPMPATATSPAPTASPLVSAEPSQPPTNPSSPQWITCPEPNCSKRYKHINGLKYHKAHAHSTTDGSKLEDTATEDSKDVTNSSDNEESMQESASVSTSPAPSFTNSVPSLTAGGKIVLNSESTSSSSSSVNGLPESDQYNLTTDLSTLAAVAIGDSTQKVNNARPISSLHSTASQDISVVIPDGENALPPTVLPISVSNESLIPTSHSDVLSVSSPGPCSSTAVSAVTTSVIQSSSSLENVATTQGVSMNIPGSHVIFNQSVLGSSSTTTCSYTSASAVCNNTPAISPSNSNLSSNASTTTTFAAISSIVSTTIASPATSLPLLDKSKIKQERPDKYKPKSPLGIPSIRPIVPAPTPLISLNTNIPGSHPGMAIGNHCVVNSPLKPIQPKPTILGEPNTVNPALESLKKEKSKHKKKSKDKEREKRISSLPLTPTKLGLNPGEECEALELTSYPSLEAVSGPLSNTAHPALTPLISQSKPPETSIDLSLPDDTMNENVQSPAYSDISDANDTAPVLESEVPSGKEKEDKIGKLTPDASQSPATNISAYGMYPYYSQPPYLLPSVSPQAAVTGSQGPNVIEKSDLTKKPDSDRAKENRPWSNPSGDVRERQHLDPHELEKKQSREENLQNASPAGSGIPMQEYPIPQHYPYPYGYVQGYPYPVDSSSYHMHMLESDPHYKQQYKQYLDEHHRMYKEQQHHQQQQQQLQHMHQIQQHHQQQQQQQQHQQQHQSHHGHLHSQHQSSHHQKSHHSSMKDDRDRSRESKDRSGNTEKVPSSGIVNEHSSKIQHSSNPMIPTKDMDVREIEMRPPSLPAQSRVENSSSASALKEKQNENHQILKENIELKSQMDDSKNKINQYEMAMLYERHKEDMRRFYMGQDRLIEQQQQKMEPGIHHHTHHHQTIQSSSSYPTSLKPFIKDDLSGPSAVPAQHSKSNHYGDSTRSSPAKSDHSKSIHSSTSSPKCNPRDSRDSSYGSSKEYINSSSSSGRESSSSSKKEGSSSSKNVDRSEGTSGREEKKSEKIKTEVKAEPEGQKPTMETTGPPPPPTNSYAYLHPSYLQPPPPHFAHMPFEPAHAMYRGGINPMIVSTPHYANSPYMHPQIRYVTPGACELPVHQPQPDPMANKLHPNAPAKALDLLHQVSQQYTSTHKIHELTEHAVMSPTPTSTPSSTPSTSSSSTSGKPSSTEPVVAVSKGDVSSRDASRSPPTQRHLHTHHHTHVGVGYPIYDPYGVAAQKTYT